MCHCAYIYTIMYGILEFLGGSDSVPAWCIIYGVLLGGIDSSVVASLYI